MKKLTALLCLVLALVSLSALTADADTETTLWPAYDPETGMWGYIDEQGMWGILAQYTWAGDFKGGCAIVQVGKGPYTCGIIDANANFVLPPMYGVASSQPGISERQDIGPMFYVYDKEGKSGWFNARNRFFSGMVWDYCETCGDQRFITVAKDVGDAWHYGLAWRETGELLVPIADWEMYGFQEGVAVAMSEFMTYIIREDGSVLSLPEGLEAADWFYQDGLLLVMNGDGLYGYVDLNGEIVIEPQFGEAESFRNGYAVGADGGSGWLIDTQGNRLAKDVYFVCGLWADGGIAVEVEGGWAVLNQDGAERFRVAMDEKWQGAVILTEPPLTEGAPWWVLYTFGGVGTSYGLMTADGEWEVEPDWTLFDDCFSGDPMGWQATGYDGGFIDAWGRSVFEQEFLYTEHFNGALARVRFDASAEGYINRSGEVVYSWPMQEE